MARPHENSLDFHQNERVTSFTSNDQSQSNWSFVDEDNDSKKVQKNRCTENVSRNHCNKGDFHKIDGSPAINIDVDDDSKDEAAESTVDQRLDLSTMVGGTTPITNLNSELAGRPSPLYEQIPVQPSEPVINILFNQSIFNAEIPQEHEYNDSDQVDGDAQSPLTVDENFNELNSSYESLNFDNVGWGNVSFNTSSDESLCAVYHEEGRQNSLDDAEMSCNNEQFNEENQNANSHNEGHNLTPVRQVSRHDMITDNYGDINDYESCKSSSSFESCVGSSLQGSDETSGESQQTVIDVRSHPDAQPCYQETGRLVEAPQSAGPVTYAMLPTNSAHGVGPVAGPSKETMKHEDTKQPSSNHINWTTCNRIFEPNPVELTAAASQRSQSRFTFEELYAITPAETSAQEERQTGFKPLDAEVIDISGQSTIEERRHEEAVRTCFCYFRIASVLCVVGIIILLRKSIANTIRNGF